MKSSILSSDESESSSSISSFSSERSPERSILNLEESKIKLVESANGKNQSQATIEDSVSLSSESDARIDNVVKKVMQNSLKKK